MPPAFNTGVAYPGQSPPTYKKHVIGLILSHKSAKVVEVNCLAHLNYHVTHLM